MNHECHASYLSIGQSPHSTTAVSPAELMFNRPLWTHLQPSIGQTVRQNQSRQKMDHDVHARGRVFKEGDNVYIRSFDGKNKWLPGTITNKQGLLTFKITLDDDQVVQCHMNHIRSRECIDLPVGTTTFDDVVPTPIEDDITEQSIASTTVTAPLRRSTRISHPLSRLIEEINN